MSASVLVVGWDGADRRLVDDLLAAGRLPHLARLAARGERRDLLALPGLGDDAHWTSFATASPPGVHPRFHYFEPQRDSDRLRYVTRVDTANLPFWATLDPDDGPVAVIDVPKSPLAPPRARPRDGSPSFDLQVADWMPHVEERPTVDIRPADHPLASLFVTDPGFECAHRRRDTASLAAHLDRIERRGSLRRDVAATVLESRHWALFVVVAAEPHCTGHHAWHHHDPSLAALGPPAADTAGDVVAASYEAADAALGRLLAATGDDTAVVVFSPTGMGPSVHGGDVADIVLRHHERTLPRQLRVRAARRRLRRVVRARAPVPEAQHAYGMWLDGTSVPIRLRVTGRDHRGIVDPGDVPALVDELADIFLALTDVDTGRSIVAAVHRTGELYPGAHVDRFADLIVVWASTRPVRRVRSPHYGELEVCTPLGRTGNHRDGGWAVCHGLADPVPPMLAVHDLGALVAAEARRRGPSAVDER